MKICIITLAEKGGMVHYASQLSIALSKNNSVHMIVPEEMNEKIGDVNIVKITIPKKYLRLKTLKFNSLIKAIDISEWWRIYNIAQILNIMAIIFNLFIIVEIHL